VGRRVEGRSVWSLKYICEGRGRGRDGHFRGGAGDRLVLTVVNVWSNLPGGLKKSGGGGGRGGEGVPAKTHFPATILPREGSLDLVNVTSALPRSQPKLGQAKLASCLGPALGRVVASLVPRAGLR
jgi:hypothetical protein